MLTIVLLHLYALQVFNIPESCRYYAFISYDRHDTAWAKWLQRRLGGYRLPSIVRKGSDRSLPKRIRPVFRDTSDLTGNEGTLGVSLREELRQSKYLILICSRHSANAKGNPDGTHQEHWVNNEVLDFVSMGRGNRIIPFIVDGIPNAADPELECFPPAIRSMPNQNQPLGISLEQDGKSWAVVRCVARMLDLKFDDLWRRHARRLRQQRITYAVMALCLLCCGLCYWDRYYRVTTAYYADYVERWGVPTGLVALDTNTLKHRSTSYRFTYRGGRVLKVEHVNSAGKLRDHTHMELADRAALLELENGYRGKLTVFPEIKFYDQHHQLLLTRSYGTTDVSAENKNVRDKSILAQARLSGVEPCVVDFKRIQRRTQTDLSSGNLSMSKSVGTLMSKSDDILGMDQGFMLSGSTTSVGGCMFSRMSSNPRKNLQNKAKSSITRLVLTYDEQTGVVKQVDFYQPDRASWKRGCDNDLIYGFRYTHDTQDRVETVTYMDAQNQALANRTGMAMKRYTREPRWGALEKTEWFADADGQSPTLNELNVASEIATFDSKTGNQLTESYFGVDGKPCLHKEGFAKVTWRYDERGNQIETSCFGIDGEPLSVLIIVNTVLSDSPAEKLGIREGDIFLRYDGQFFEDVVAFIQYRSLEAKDGEPKTLEILCGKKIIKVQVSPGQLGASLGAKAIDSATLQHLLESSSSGSSTEATEEHTPVTIMETPATAETSSDTSPETTSEAGSEAEEVPEGDILDALPTS